MSDFNTMTVYSPFLTDGKREGYRKSKIRIKPGQSVYEAVVMQTGADRAREEVEFAGCNRGVCGRCGVRFLCNAPLPTAADRHIFSPQKLRQGFRLACQCKAVKDAEIELHFTKPRKLQIVGTLGNLPGKQGTLEGTEKVAEPGLLVDIGTTTVAMQLVNMIDGHVFAEYAVLNPQRVLGADVMTRLSASEQNKEFLQESILQCILEGLDSSIEKAGTDYDILIRKEEVTVYVAGNTTMMHFLFGLSTQQLRCYPFRPETLAGLDMTMKGLRFRSLPGFSAFVGADLCADLFAVSTDKPFLLIDLGTNAEMILYNGRKTFMTAAAAGSAFDGGKEGNILGTELIHVAAKLLKSGELEESGLLSEPYFTNGYQTQQGTVSKEDIRELQKAKAAVASGIEILASKAKIDLSEVERVYLCGGFGHFLDSDEAIDIGMLPQIFSSKIESLGNVVLQGIYQYFTNEEKRTRILQIFEGNTVINLAEEKDFNQKYIENLDFKNRPE